MAPVFPDRRTGWSDVGDYVTMGAPSSITAAAAMDPTGIVIVNQIEPIALVFAFPQLDFPTVQISVALPGASPASGRR